MRIQMSGTRRSLEMRRLRSRSSQNNTTILTIVDSKATSRCIVVSGGNALGAVDEQAVQKFEAQNLVNAESVVSFSPYMSLNHGGKALPADIGAR